MIVCAALIFALFLYFGAQISAKFTQNLNKFTPNLRAKFLSQKVFKWAFAAIFTMLFFVPIFEGYSSNALIFAFFDKPCLFFTLFLGIFIIKILLKDLLNKDLKLNLTLKSSFWLAFSTSFLFLSYLNILNFDLYHASIFAQSLFCFVFVFVLFILSRILGVLALIALALNLTIPLNSSIDTLVCVYLWAFAMISFLILLKGKLCKNRLKA